MRASYLFTSESVSEGHPDKVSDQISDAVLDAFLAKDVELGIADNSLINTRLGCETLCTTNKIVIAGEGRGQLFRTINGKSVVDRELISKIARDVVRDIGYDQDGFSYHGADIEVLLHGQSPDIAMGVDAKKKKTGEEEGAGDQGMMFGYACTESEVYEKGSFMPAPIFFAHRILKTLSEKRRNGQLADLQPDSKSQVTVKYVDGKPVGCKDATKVDRSAAYAARYLAKNVVAAGLADRCTIQVAYAIGVADPMSLLVETHGTGKVDEKKLEKVLPELFRLTPTNIRRTLKLNRPIYRRTASYGHFGRAPEKDGGFSWERTDLADALRRAV
jgi:S-adenosylmethionine synthetase